MEFDVGFDAAPFKKEFEVGRQHIIVKSLLRAGVKTQKSGTLGKNMLK